MYHAALTYGNHAEGFALQCFSFFSCSCQFVVADNGDYSIHTSDPDLLVDWDSIELVVSHTHTHTHSILYEDLHIIFLFAAFVLP